MNLLEHLLRKRIAERFAEIDEQMARVDIDALQWAALMVRRSELEMLLRWLDEQKKGDEWVE